MTKKLVITTLAGVLLIFVYTTISFLKIQAYRDIPASAQKYDQDGALKFPDTKEDIEKRKKALKLFSSKTQKHINGEKIDYEKILSLDHTRYAWWIKRNNENKPTSIPENIQKMISKYDGIYLGDTSKKKIYLTFDEGYENGYTSKILDTLKKYEVKAVFFVTAPYVKGNPELVKRMLAEGHLVGNHTIHHPSLPSINVDRLEEELWGFDKQFRQVYGIGFKYMRPPRGEYSERVLAASKQLGYKTMFWSFAYKDFDVNDQKGVDYAYDKVMRNLHNGAVILLHAVSKDNADALDRIIRNARAEGYEISPMDL